MHIVLLQNNVNQNNNIKNVSIIIFIQFSINVHLNTEVIFLKNNRNPTFV
jgi:hypothetical protein